VIYTTSAGSSATHPSWGERFSLSLTWGVCKRSALRFRVLPPTSSSSANEEAPWHLGECVVALGDVQHEHVSRLTKELHPAATDDADIACGHLQLSVLLTPEHTSSHGRVYLSSTLSPLSSATPSPLESLSEAEAQLRGQDTKTSQSSKWIVRVEQLVNILPSNKGYGVAFFDGKDGSWLGETSRLSSASGLWNESELVTLNTPSDFDSKVPIGKKKFRDPISQ